MSAELAGAKVFVTGADGFIGSHLVEAWWPVARASGRWFTIIPGTASAGFSDCPSQCGRQSRSFRAMCATPSA